MSALGQKPTSLIAGAMSALARSGHSCALAIHRFAEGRAAGHYGSDWAASPTNWHGLARAAGLGVGP